MSIRWLEAGVPAGFGVVDQAVDSKAGTTNWGTGAFNQKWSFLLELAGVAAGLWGDKVKLGPEFREPIGFVSLGLIGRRATRYSMAAGGVSNLFKPGGWAAMGGEGDFSAVGNGSDSSQVIPLAAAGGRTQDRLLGARGGYPTYPPVAELPGMVG